MSEIIINGKKFERIGYEPRKLEAEKPRINNGEEPRNYSQPDPMNVSLQGRSMTVLLLDGKAENGICMKMGQYFLELESQGKTILINKGMILEVIL